MMGRDGPRLLGEDEMAGMAAREPGRAAARGSSRAADERDGWDRDAPHGLDETPEAREPLDEAALREVKRRRRAPTDPSRLSQTNRGLRMILIAAVLIVAMSWAATVGREYLSYLKVQELAQNDPDALRVMCAVRPPTEKEIGLMHLCETAARAAPQAAATDKAE